MNVMVTVDILGMLVVIARGNQVQTYEWGPGRKGHLPRKALPETISLAT